MMEITEMTPERLAGMIDHTFLKAYGGSEEIESLCREARLYGFAMVAVNPAETGRCVTLLEGSQVRTGAAIGFPLGQATSETKVFETRDAIEKGAGEIDMVINIRALQSGDEELVYSEIARMAEICAGAGVISKVILETCYLSDGQKRRVCELALRAGVDFVKTSTGFGTGGATVADVALMRSVVGNSAGVKASGGIRNLDDAVAMIAAGATRIGTSSGVAIIEELKRRNAAL